MESNSRNMSINVPVDIYTDLNRASREYDMTITDLYYFILNGNKVDSEVFEELFTDAFNNFYAYAAQKDRVSNELVIPAVREAFNLEDSDVITNKWTINFDGSHICNISDILIDKNNQMELYSGEANPKWIQGINYNTSKMEILDLLISKLVTTINENSASIIKEEYKKLRDMRVKFAIEKDEAQAALMKEEVDEIIKNEDPAKCTWKIDPIAKTLIVTKTVD